MISTCRMAIVSYQHSHIPTADPEPFISVRSMTFLPSFFPCWPCSSKPSRLNLAPFLSLALPDLGRCLILGSSVSNADILWYTSHAQPPFLGPPLKAGIAGIAGTTGFGAFAPESRWVRRLRSFSSWAHIINPILTLTLENEGQSYDLPPSSPWPTFPGPHPSLPCNPHPYNPGPSR